MVNVKNPLRLAAQSTLSTKTMDGAITVTLGVMFAVTTLVNALSAKTLLMRFKACIVYALWV